MYEKLNDLNVGDEVLCTDSGCSVKDHTGTVISVDGYLVDVEWWNGSMSRSTEPREHLLSKRDAGEEKGRRTREKKRAKYQKGR